jgi:hypothetical protein
MLTLLFPVCLDDLRPRQILIFKGDARRVSFEAEARRGLHLCPVDIHPGNFKILEDKIVALDFHATCFLPESFIAYAMRVPLHRQYNFTLNVAKNVDYPQSSNINAMVAASWYLVVHGGNKIGQPNSFRFT